MPATSEVEVQGPQGFQPVTEAEMIKAIYYDMGSLRNDTVRLERNMNDGFESIREEHKADREFMVEKLDDHDSRLTGVERLLWGLTWVGGPAWGILLLILGAVVGNVVSRTWPTPH